MFHWSKHADSLVSTLFPFGTLTPPEPEPYTLTLGKQLAAGRAYQAPGCDSNRGSARAQQTEGRPQTADNFVDISGDLCTLPRLLIDFDIRALLLLYIPGIHRKAQTLW